MSSLANSTSQVTIGDYNGKLCAKKHATYKPFS